MAMLGEMKRNKSHSGKVTARLPDALKRSYRAWIQDVADDHKYFGRRLGVEQCTGAIVQFFMEGLEDAGRRDLLKEWLPVLAENEKRDWSKADATNAGGDEGDATSIDAAEVAIPLRRPTGRKSDSGGEDAAIVVKHRGPAGKK